MINYIRFLMYKVIEDKTLVEFDYEFVVKKSLKERLFSWPWRPFKKEITITNTKPSKLIYKKDDCLVMHPTVAKRLRNYVKNNKHFLVAAYLRKYLR